MHHFLYTKIHHFNQYSDAFQNAPEHQLKNVTWCIRRDPLNIGVMKTLTMTSSDLLINQMKTHKYCNNHNLF